MAHIRRGGITKGEWTFMGERQPSRREVMDWALFLKCVCERKKCDGYTCEEDEDAEPCPYAFSRYKENVRCLFVELTGRAPCDWSTDRPSGLEQECHDWWHEGQRYDMFCAAARGKAPWPKEYTMSMALKYTTSFWACSEEEALERARGELYADQVDTVQDWTVDHVEEPDDGWKERYIQNARRDEEDADD